MSDQEVNKDASGCKELTVIGEENNKLVANMDAQKMAERVERINQLRLKLKTAKVTQ